ncbi:hypothetical protein [Calothrix rhizosoleniae]|uniref:hypothetical protein n=1 Tax=Calothrix rhizosoleniae TaxID=888997 RepID=UPI000B49B876|nr:hypothetical protein [Calothrix rhizosoleniae]
MAISALKKFFIPPVFASLAAFSAMTVPLGLLGDKLIEIKLEQEPFFHGRLREGAIGYVIGATAISLGAGISMLAMSGWRNSSRKSLAAEQKLSNLEKHLQEKEDLIRELKLSESRLQISGLRGFLDDEVPFNPSLNPRDTVSQPVVAQTPAQVYQSPIHPPGNEMSSISSPNPQNPSNQEFAGYAQTTPNTDKVTNQITENTEFEELQKQLQNMMLQMQAMQHHLQVQTPTRQTEVAKTKFQVYYETPDLNEVQFQRS